MSDDRDASFDELRQRIDAIDRKILEALAERRGVSRAIIEAKARGESPLRDQSREERLLLDRIDAARSLGLDSTYVTKIFHQIIDDSVRLQQELLQELANDEGVGQTTLRVAFLGSEGSYSHLAARAAFARRNARLAPVSASSFDDIVKAVEAGRADYGVLPIENTTSGGINEVYDLLLHTRLSIVGEHKLRIDHCLLGVPGATLDGLEVLHSHPQPLAQCSAFLASLGDLRTEIASDTATSVRHVADLGDPAHAAIGGFEAGRMYGLEPLARDIANHTENFTRFLIVARQPVKVDLRVPAKTSLVIATSQRAGALVEALLVFRRHGLNLTKLESRPILGNPWEEMFYVDVQGNAADPRVVAALDELEAHTRSIRLLGTYPSDDLPPTEVPVTDAPD
jgi:chorismate mutase/prephenate dehydratase